jgi:SAM-dependent methyltransferase
MPTQGQTDVSVLQPRRTPLLNLFLEQRVLGADDVDLAIHPKDEMLHYLVEVFDGDWNRAIVGYIESGVQVAEMAGAFLDWRFGERQHVSFLDFASGYGRVTRHLLQILRPEQVVVSDIMEEAVEFQTLRFGVEGWVSCREARKFRSDRLFSCVQAVSLFSHLPERSFREWIGRLWALVRPGGLLVFTVHDWSLRGDAANQGGFVFSPTSENQLLDKHDYGTTWVTEESVHRILTDEIDGFSLCRFPRGLANYQDVYLVVRETGVDFSRLEYFPGIDGHIDSADFLRPGELRCFGWASHRVPDQSIKEVRFELSGNVIASTASFTARPDVVKHLRDKRHLMSGWCLDVNLPERTSFSDDPVMLRVISCQKEDRLLHMGCVYSIVAEAARKNLNTLSAQMKATKTGRLKWTGGA